MLRKKTTFGLLALLLSLALLAGCSDQAGTADQTSDGEFDLTSDFGGYKPTGEEPGFGDSEVLSVEGSEAADDPLFSSPYVESLRTTPDRDVYSLEILWGNLQYDSTATDITDWSGSLTVERGAIVALRLIRFDRGQDYIIRPRDTCTTLEWVSFTSVHYDGIHVLIYDPQPDSFESENSVTFDTPPYSRTFAMAELDSIDEIIDVGNNQVSINGFKTEFMECPEGFMFGHWVRQGYDGERGRFHGRWLSADGYHIGHVKGHWGVREDGERVLFGKWISLGGHFRGLLRGTWGHDPEVDDVLGGHGWFDGRWFDVQLVERGGFSGNWVAVRPHPGNGNGNVNGNGNGLSNAQRRGHGLFRAQWWSDCE